MTPNVPVTTVRALLSFADASGARASVSVPRASAGLSEPQLRASMAGMLATGALSFDKVPKPTAAVGAKVISVTKTLLVGK